MAVRQHNLTEVEFTLEEVHVRDQETDEEQTMWQISHTDLDRPCRAGTPQEALNLFASCISKAPSEKDSIDLEELVE